MTTIVRPTVLIVGASRGLGHAMAAEFLRHGWNVIGTVRDIQPTTPLHQLAQEKPRSGTSGNAGYV
ncbi:short chain dehydrogenase [Raoultella planticola]|nr:short chain dehydrogenase [Raoultella planticola]